MGNNSENNIVEKKKSRDNLIWEKEREIEYKEVQCYTENFERRFKCYETRHKLEIVLDQICHNLLII